MTKGAHDEQIWRAELPRRRGRTWEAMGSNGKLCPNEKGAGILPRIRLIPASRELRPPELSEKAAETAPSSKQLGFSIPVQLSTFSPYV